MWAKPRLLKVYLFLFTKHAPLFLCYVKVYFSVVLGTGACINFVSEKGDFHGIQPFPWNLPAELFTEAGRVATGKRWH